MQFLESLMRRSELFRLNSNKGFEEWAKLEDPYENYKNYLYK
jgi:hypothetical protein